MKQTIRIACAGFVLMLCALATPPALAQIVLVGSSLDTAGGGSHASVTLARPAGVAFEDVLVAQIALRAGNPTITAPPGWTLAGLERRGSLAQAIYYRVATAAEPASYTWSFDAFYRLSAALSAFRGVYPAGPINALASADGAGTAATSPSVTTTVADTLLLGFFAVSHGTAAFATPPGMTEFVDWEGGAGPNGTSIAADLEARPAAGATGPRTANATAGNSWVAQTLALRPIPVIDHLRLLHDGSGLTCAPETITVQVCADLDCTLLYTDPVTITLAPTGWVGGDTVSFSGGSAALPLRHTTLGIVTLDGVVDAPTPAADPTRCFIGGVETCALEFHEAGFVLDVPGLIAGQDSAAITVNAVKADPLDPQTCAPAFTGARSVAFWSSYLSPATGTLPVRVNGSAIAGASPGTALTLTFDANAQAQIVVAYDDAGLVNLDLRHDGSGTEAGLVMLGSDQFAVRPETLCVRAPQPNSDCSPVDPGCSAFVGAGRDFVLELRAVRWVSGSTDACSNPVTPNYQHGPVALSHALLAPVGGAAGTLAIIDATFVAADAGVHAVSSQQVSEVGVFEFTATPPAYFGLTIPAGTSVPVGRFVPDHFDVVVEDGCAGGALFTWSGQPFTATAMARNGAGATTLNYHGAFGFARDTELSDAGDSTGFSDNTIAAADFVDGIGSTSAVSYAHATPPQPPTTLDLRAIDTDGVSSNGFLEGSTEVRSGRLRLANGFGSGRENLPLPLSVQSWQDIDPPNLLYAWNTETADTCTVLATGDFSLAGLATSVSAVNLAVGLGTVTLSAPNAYGHVDVTAELDTLAPWLQFDWDGDGTAQNPTARAGFELQPGSNRQIYRREVIGGN